MSFHTSHPHKCLFIQATLIYFFSYKPPSYMSSHTSHMCLFTPLLTFEQIYVSGTQVGSCLRNWWFVAMMTIVWFSGWRQINSNIEIGLSNKFSNKLSIRFWNKFSNKYNKRLKFLISDIYCKYFWVDFQINLKTKFKKISNKLLIKF